ncbi:hypothetical protein A2U01_0106595, partial [Trifolium medium]|nr:hypothetical protein [Trifolium medium]
MGLNKFSGTVIKSVLAGLEITISREHLAKLLGVEDSGKKIFEFKSNIYYRQSIKKELYNADQVVG